jgi:hypothetical protein
MSSRRATHATPWPTSTWTSSISCSTPGSRTRWFRTAQAAFTRITAEDVRGGLGILGSANGLGMLGKPQMAVEYRADCFGQVLARRRFRDKAGAAVIEGATHRHGIFAGGDDDDWDRGKLRRGSKTGRRSRSFPACEDRERAIQREVGDSDPIPFGILTMSPQLARAFLPTLTYSGQR